MKRLIFILAFLIICIQILAEGIPLDNNKLYSKTPTINISNIGDRYLIYLHSNDDNPDTAEHRETLVFIINKRDSIFLSQSAVPSYADKWKDSQYSATNIFELSDTSTLLNRKVTEVVVLMDDGSFETYNIADEYQKDFSSSISNEIYAAKARYDEKYGGSNVFWWFVLGVIGLLLLVAIVYNVSKKSSSKSAVLKDLKQTVKSTPPQESEPKTLIDQGQYYYLCKYSKELQKLFRKLSEDKKFLSSVNDMYVGAGKEGKSYSEVLYLDLRAFFIKDLHHCFDEMGYRFLYTTKTDVGQCLYAICSASGISSSIAYISFDMFDKEMNNVDYKELAEDRESLDYWENIGNLAFPLKVDDEFKISSLLLSCNGKNDDLRSYRILLYKLVTILAQVDDDHKEQKQALIERIKISYEQMTQNELAKLIGLRPVKEEVQTLSNYILMRQKRKEMGLSIPEVSYHLVFTGNPGTGKTTVARILAGIFHDLGVLKKGHLVETDRSGLVAEYVGQTAVKTNKIIDKALDGVLFIDEAYSLIAQGEDFGQEAVATLLKRMEDDRDRLIVILAGYTEEMEEFINSNPGLRSRFNRYIFFPDYSADELAEIFLSMAKKHEYTMSEEVKQFIINKLEDVVANKPKDFGNARYVRNLFERVVQSQANRLAKESNLSKGMLTEITIEDIRD